jgi:MFS family permease
VNMLISSLAFGASFSFLGVRLDEDIGASALMIGIAFSVQDLTAGFGQPLFGYLADHYNRRLLVAIGVFSLSGFMFLMGITSVYLLILPLMFGMGAAKSLSDGTGAAIQVVAGRKVGMGTLLGLNSFANGAGIVTGSVVGGVLADRFETSAAFFFASAVIGTGACVFLALTAGVAVNETPEERIHRVERDPVELAAVGQ